MKPHIKVAILNWNGIELLKRCLDSVLNIKYPNFSIVVIDNYSADGSIRFIKKRYPDVEIMQLNNNYGYAGGYNRYFNKLNENSTDYILILNNDTKVDQEILNHFNNARKEYGNNNIYGGKIFYSEKPQTLWYAGGEISCNNLFIKHRGIRQKDSMKYSKIIETDYVTGCCLFTSVKVIKDLNGFDESFNMYCEDVDLCIRAKQNNIKIFFYPKVKLWHDVSASVGGNFSINKILNKFKSLVRLFIKNSPKIYFLIDILNSIFVIVKYTLSKKYKIQDERTDPNNSEWENHYWINVFKLRATYAKKYVENKLVLDLCCGTGWMAHEISKTARDVIAVDYSQDAIKIAKKKYSSKNIVFKKMNALKLKFKYNYFDTVVSMEAIEHFTKSDGCIFIKQVHNVLKDGGVFIGSTPNVKNRNPFKLMAMKKIDPFHLFLYSEKILVNVLSKQFKEVKVIPQKNDWLLFIAIK